MNQTRYYLLVEVGPAKGQRHFIPENGAKLGRSSQNDICIVDPQLSRQHCAFEFRSGMLWIKDLESANFTLVNDLRATEQPLRAGDRIHVGETVLRVVAEDAPTTNAAGIPGVSVVTPGAETPPAPLITIPAPAEPATPPAPSAPLIDLGLKKSDEPAKNPGAQRTILYLVGALLILVLGVLLIFDFGGESKSEKTIAPVVDNDQTLQFVYEKVEATPNNIFRFSLTLSPNGQFAARMTDLEQKRSIQREKTITPADLDDLIARLKAQKFMELDENYTAQNPQANHMTSYDLTLVIGKQARRSRVINRPEPAAFKNVREMIETFGKNELGLWTLTLSAEELTQKAAANLDEARSYVRDASIDRGNLWKAIQRYRDAETNLESVDPKPDFYPDIITGLETAKEQHDAEFNELRYSAEHAIKTSSWEAARRHLQDICRLVPDPQDERNRTATRELIDVENRIRRH